MKIELDIPDDLKIVTLEEWHPARRGERIRWRVGLSIRGSFYLQARMGFSPQEAVDECVAGIRASQAKWAEYEATQTPDLGITLDLSSLGVLK